MSQNLTKSITFKLSESTYKHLKMVCELDQITMSALIQRALTMYFLAETYELPNDSLAMEKWKDYKLDNNNLE